MTQNQYLSRQEAAEILNVPLGVIDRLISTGVLPRYRIRERYIRVRRRDIDELVDVPRDWLLRC